MNQHVDTLNLDLDERISCVKENQHALACMRLIPGDVLGTSDTYDVGKFAIVRATRNAEMTIDASKREIMISAGNEADTFDCELLKKSGIGTNPRKILDVLECK